MKYTEMKILSYWANTFQFSGHSRYMIFGVTINRLLGGFAKLSKAILASSCLSTRPSIRPSARVEQLGSHWTHFHEI
jgi:hypothetical protein